MIAAPLMLEHCKRVAGFTKLKARVAADFAKAKARWAWRHRTKTAGGLAMAAGSLEGFITSHPALAKSLPGSGTMLIVFGGVVTAIGGYNTLADIFGWKDDPAP
jgi:hypothetical protein